MRLLDAEDEGTQICEMPATFIIQHGVAFQKNCVCSKILLDASCFKFISFYYNCITILLCHKRITTVKTKFIDHTLCNILRCIGLLNTVATAVFFFRWRLIFPAYAKNNKLLHPTFARYILHQIFDCHTFSVVLNITDGPFAFPSPVALPYQVTSAP
jgi:hypothetical protein